MYDDLPNLALSIQNPWGWLIAHGHKDIENRDWATKVRGTVAIHVGQKLDRECVVDLKLGLHPVTGEVQLLENTDGAFQTGGIIGLVDIVDCVERSSSDWFCGKYGFILENARPLLFIPVKGALGFFKWKDRVL